MNEVNLSQLYRVTNLYLECDYPYFEELREAFFVLDICGCRIEELFQIERWSFIGGDVVQLIPQKNNLPRTIVLDANTQNFKNCIINQTKPFLGRTSYQLQYLFRKLNPYIPIYSGGREISLYCYRYKHIWQMQADGFTTEEMMNEMGHRTVTPILLYLAAHINSTYEIPVNNGLDFGGVNYQTVKIAGLEIITRDLIYNDGGDGIYTNPIISDFIEKFGLIYSWAAKERIKQLLPANWRIPTIADMTLIFNQFGGLSGTSYLHRLSDLFYWQNSLGTNISGLSFAGTGYHYNSNFAGYRIINYMHLDDYKSSTTYYLQSLGSSSSNIALLQSGSKSSMKSSIRILKTI